MRMGVLSSTATDLPPSSSSESVVAVPASTALAAGQRMHVYPPFASLAASRAELVQEGYGMLRTASASASAAGSPGGRRGGESKAAAAADFKLASALSQGDQQTTPVLDLSKLAVATLLRTAAACGLDSSSAGPSQLPAVPPATAYSTGTSQGEVHTSELRQRLKATLEQAQRTSGGADARARVPTGSYVLEHMQLMGNAVGHTGAAGKHVMLDEAAFEEEEGVSDDMVGMSGALREATQAMADRLRADNQVLDSATAAAGDNLSSISATQAELSSENQGATVTFISTLLLLGVVACVFVGTYAAIRFLPK